MMMHINTPGSPRQMVARLACVRSGDRSFGASTAALTPPPDLRRGGLCPLGQDSAPPSSRITAHRDRRPFELRTHPRRPWVRRPLIASGHPPPSFGKRHHHEYLLAPQRLSGSPIRSGSRAAAPAHVVARRPHLPAPRPVAAAPEHQRRPRNAASRSALAAPPRRSGTRRSRARLTSRGAPRARP